MKSAARAFDARWLHQRLLTLLTLLPQPGSGGAPPATGQPRLCLAYSGGADSTALLAALAELQAEKLLAVRAVHVDHRLQSQSAEWARRSRSQARALGVACRTVSVNAQRRAGESPEAAARSARYDVLLDQLRSNELLLTAHHLEDQAETVLLRQLRGAGLAGQAAMAERSLWRQRVLLRPLLSVPRAALRDYLQQRGIGWVEDPSNADLRFDRNFLRAEVLPRLLARWPAAAEVLARGAAGAAEAQGLLDSALRADLDCARDGDTLRATVLRRHPPARRCALLRLWLAQQGLRAPERRQIEEMAGPLLAARADAQAEASWGEHVVRVHGDRLWLGRRQAPPPAPEQTWDWTRKPRLEIPGSGTLRLRQGVHGLVDMTRLPVPLAVRFRTGGERLVLGGGKVELKNWLQSHEVPHWRRSRLPLLYHGNELLAVADLWSHPRLQADAGAQRRAWFTFAPDPD